MDYRDWTPAQLRAEIVQMRARAHDARARGHEKSARTCTAEIAAMQVELTARTLRV